MASVERPTTVHPVPDKATVRTIGGERYACWTDRKGQAVRALILPSGKCRRTAPGRFVGVYRDHTGKKAKTETYGSRSAAMSAALDAEKRAKEVREGRAEPERAVGKSLLSHHVGDYLEHLIVEGTGKKRRRTVDGILSGVIAKHKLTTAGAVDCERLARLLEADRVAGGIGPAKPGQVREPLSLRARNMWVITLRAFGKWLRRSKRATGNPFDELTTVNSEVDRRRVRRALPEDLFARLVTAAHQSADEVQGLDGQDRALMYLLGAYTGLRAGALRQLTPEAFTWGKGVPVAVFSSARLQKNKGAHGIGIHPAIAAAVGAWLKTRTPGRPIFQGNAHMRTAEMVQHDLAAAGLPYKDAAGEVFDFHALRVEAGYLMWAGGVSLVAAAEILDHSDPKLTAKIYTRFGGELGREVAKMPVPLALTGGSFGSKFGTGLDGSRGKQPSPVNKKSPPKTKKPHKS